MIRSQFRNTLTWIFLLNGILIVLVLSILSTYFFDTQAGYFAFTFLPYLLEFIGASLLIIALIKKLKVREFLKKIKSIPLRITAIIGVMAVFWYVIIFISFSADPSFYKNYAFLFGIGH